MFNLNPLWVAVMRAVGLVSSFDASFMGTLAPGFTFSRSSSAMMTASNGNLVWAPHNNQLTSGTLNTWVLQNSTVVAAPGEASGTWRIQENSATSTHGIQSPAQAAAPAYSRLTASVRLKAAERGFAFLQINDSTSANAAWCSFNLSTGAVVQAPTMLTGAFTSMSAGAISEGNGWYRCYMSFSLNSVADVFFNAGTSLNGSSRSHTGVTGSAVIAADPQVEFTSANSPQAYQMTSGSPAQSPRFDYANGTLQGLLMEGQATNLCALGGESTTFMTSVAGTRAPSASPILGLPAGTYTSDSTSSSHYYAGGSLNTALAASSVYTASVYIRAGTALFAQVATSSSNAPTTVYTNVNLTTGAVSSGAGVSAASTTALGGGVWRITMTFTSSASPVSGGISVLVCPVTSLAVGRLEIHTNVLSFDAVGFQLEAGPQATSYIPTTGGPATRATDTCTAPVGAWYNPIAGTLVSEWVRNSITPGSLGFNPSVSALRNTTTTNLGVRCGSGTPAQQRFDVVDGTTQAQVGMPNGVAGVVYKVASRYAVNDFHSYQNGVAGTPDTTGTVPTGITTLELGNYGTTSPLNGHIRRFTYYNSALTNAELQALST